MLIAVLIRIVRSEQVIAVQMFASVLLRLLEKPVEVMGAVE
jgi:hypothetical protein